MTVPNTPRRPRRRVTPPTERKFPPQGAVPPRPPRRPIPRVITRIEIPGRTIFQVLLTLAAIALLWRLRDIVLQIFIASILAAGLAPLVSGLQKRGFPRAAAITTVLLSFLAVIAIIIFLIAQPLVDEAQEFIQNLPAYIEQIQGLLNTNRDLYNRIIEAANSFASDPASVVTPILTAGRDIVSGISGLVIAVIMAIYILVEGERIFNWLTRDLSPYNRGKLRVLIPQLTQVVSGYMTGQAITSVLFAVYTFAVLSILGVPQPLLLAVVNAFADAIPIVGVISATIPAALLALTVSPTAVIVVLVAYLVYQQIENYVIVPRVFQGTLQISPFAVLIAVLIGSNLLGIIGALLALPVAAAIPVIERVWLGEEIPEEIAELTGDRPEEDET